MYIFAVHFVQSQHSICICFLYVSCLTHVFVPFRPSRSFAFPFLCTHNPLPLRITHHTQPACSLSAASCYCCRSFAISRWVCTIDAWTIVGICASTTMPERANRGLYEEPPLAPNIVWLRCMQKKEAVCQSKCQKKNKKPTYQTLAPHHVYRTYIQETHFSRVSKITIFQSICDSPSTHIQLKYTQACTYTCL